MASHLLWPEGALGEGDGGGREHLALATEGSSSVDARLCERAASCLRRWETLASSGKFHEGSRELCPTCT